MSWKPLPTSPPPGQQLGTVYMLCFDEPYEHARHYIGWSRMLAWRLLHHRNGTSGVPLLHALKGAGIGFELVLTVPGTHWHERRLKNRGSAVRICPRCRARRKSELRKKGPYTPRGLKIVTTRLRRQREAYLRSVWLTPDQAHRTTVREGVQ